MRGHGHWNTVNEACERRSKTTRARIRYALAGSVSTVRYGARRRVGAGAGRCDQGKGLGRARGAATRRGRRVARARQAAAGT
jgi:hypothetical protein